MGKQSKPAAWLRKNLANGITLLRVPLAVGLALAPPFSAGFWACYLGGGLSDMLDGPVARRLHQQSALGAKLDSLADLAFALALAWVALVRLTLPGWLLLWAAAVAAVRCAGYALGACKYHAFSALHTWANKAAGALLFGFPLLDALLGHGPTGILLGTAASLSAAEELLITLRADRLDRDCRGLLWMK